VKKSKHPPRTGKWKLKSHVPFPVVSVEMRHWSAMLAAELGTWPCVSTKPMFGSLAFYHGDKIFAALPQTRGLKSASSFILKFDPMPPPLLKRAYADSRLDTHTRVPGKGWFSFELNAESDLGDALYWLNQAYEACAKQHPRR